MSLRTQPIQQFNPTNKTDNIKGSISSSDKQNCAALSKQSSLLNIQQKKQRDQSFNQEDANPDQLTAEQSFFNHSPEISGQQDIDETPEVLEASEVVDNSDIEEVLSETSESVDEESSDIEVSENKEKKNNLKNILKKSKTVVGNFLHVDNKPLGIFSSEKKEFNKNSIRAKISLSLKLAGVALVTIGITAAAAASLPVIGFVLFPGGAILMTAGVAGDPRRVFFITYNDEKTDVNLKNDADNKNNKENFTIDNTADQNPLNESIDIDNSDQDPTMENITIDSNSTKTPIFRENGTVERIEIDNTGNASIDSIVEAQTNLAYDDPSLTSEERERMLIEAGVDAFKKAAENGAAHNMTKHINAFNNAKERLQIDALSSSNADKNVQFSQSVDPNKLSYK